MSGFVVPDIMGEIMAQAMTPRTGDFPHRVILRPPASGFSDEVEEDIIDFLVARPGAFDVFADMHGAAIYYCFRRAADASAFHAAFAHGAAAAELQIASA